MSTSIKLILQDGHREAVIGAVTSEAGTLAIENTQNDSLAELWRSEDTSNDSALVQTISNVIMPVSIDGHGGIALAYTNLTLNADVSVTFKNGTGTVTSATLECIEENIDGTTTWAAFVNSTEEIDRYDLTIDDSGDSASAANSDGYIQAARIICGPAIVTEYCLPPGAVMDYIEGVEHIVTDALSLKSEGTGVVKRRASIDLNLISKTERASFVAALKTDGRGYAGFVSLYENWGGSLEASGAFVAKRMEDYRFTHWKGPGGSLGNRFRSTLEFREV